MPIPIGTVDGGGETVGPPIMGTATAGDTKATITFTPPTYTGKGNISYIATSSPSGLTGTSGGSPVVVENLTNGVSYTFTIYNLTSYGLQSPSTVPSNAVTPFAPVVCPSYGTLLAANQCSGFTLFNLRADGACGTYQEILAYNSGLCNYEPPAPQCSPPGTFIGNACVGQQLNYELADGSCGSYLSPVGYVDGYCGYTPLPACGCCYGYSAQSARYCYYTGSPGPGGVWYVDFGVQFDGSCGASGPSTSGVNCSGACQGCSCPAPYFQITSSGPNGQGGCSGPFL